MDSFTIGEVARQAQVAVDTVRYYERNRLLPEAPRRPSGYREYDQDDVKRLRFIRRAKELGFTLAEIRELLALSVDRERGVRGVKDRAQTRLAEVERRIRELEQVRQGLTRLIADCPGRGALDRCPILAALGEESTT